MAKLTRAQLEEVYYRLLYLWDNLERDLEKIVLAWLKAMENDLYIVVDNNNLNAVWEAIEFFENEPTLWKEQAEKLQEKAEPIYIATVQRVTPVIAPILEPFKKPVEEPVEAPVGAPAAFVQPDPYAQFIPTGPVVPWPHVPDPVPKEILYGPTIKTRLDNIKGITDTVKKDILAELHREGATEKSVADAIRAAIGEKDISEARAKTIANTEIGGMIADTQLAEFLGVGVTRIQWQTMGDGKVRPTHQLCDGRIVTIGDPFPNGLLYPHDPNGGPEEVCNCRCWFTPVEEER